MTYLLIDGNSILNRAYYGIRPLTTKDGRNTNAVYGFLTILAKHIKEYTPCRIFAAFDRKEKTPRHELYPAYKAGRKPMPQELAEQFPVIKEVLGALGVSCIEKPGLEADDLLGTLSRTLPQGEDNCVILTGDRDAFQLVSPKVSVCLATTKGDFLYTEDRLKEAYGLAPTQMIDLKAMMGDNSDNIPGIPGVGEKTALTLMHTYGSLEELYTHTDDLKGALRQKVLDGRESAFLSRKLGTIVTDADLSAEVSVPAVRNNEKLSALFRDLEMTSLFSRFSVEEESAKKEPGEESVGLRESDVLPQGDSLSVLLKDQTLYVYGKEKIIFSVPLTDPVLHELSHRKLIVHDAKPLLRCFLAKNLPYTLAFDTMLAAYLLNASRSGYPLPELIAEYTGHSLPDAVGCVPYLSILAEKLEQLLEEKGQKFLYETIELPLCSVLADMEVKGFPADRTFLSEFGKTLDADIANYAEAIHLATGHDFNINSTKQLGVVLFEEQGFPVIRKTKTGYSTDNDVLEELLKRTENPLIQNIMDYRKLVKLKSTYVDGMTGKIDAEGRIHTVFTQTVTQTGRISSTEPNLQNIPIRTALGRELRRAFRARDGYVLIDADYSQIELRVLADIAGDENMARAFRENLDIHTITASQVFGLPEEMITPELRRRAKAVNFGIVYGIGEYSLSRDIGVSVKEAKRYIENYLRTYSGVRNYMHRIVEQARESGYVETKFGRRRYVPDIHAKNHQLRAFAERVCMNTPIQGTAADIIKLAMVHVHRRLKNSGMDARLILQVHDELILEAPEDQKEELGAVLKEEMENAVRLSVPLIAEVGFGKTWYDAKE